MNLKKQKMEKKYKLIKEYPGSPKLGTIVNQRKGTNMYFYKYLQICYPERYSEFWEKVAEKDYRILQMKNTSGNFYSLFENEELGRYERENHTIHSVVRLSDGEIFTVGDNTDYGIIKNIYLNQIDFSDGKGTQKILTFHVSKSDEDLLLNDFNKAKQPLFTTEDGVDIFEGDKYFIVWEHSFSTTNALANSTHKKMKGQLDFSTKQLAEEYILLNSPVLCLKDLMDRKNKLFNLDEIADIVRTKIGDRIYKNKVKTEL